MIEEDTMQGPIGANLSKPYSSVLPVLAWNTYFRITPLGYTSDPFRVPLPFPGAHIVTDRVTRDILQGVFLRYILGVLANDDHQLCLIICFPFLSTLWDGDPFVIVS
jgi:hypothetical protein